MCLIKTSLNLLSKIKKIMQPFQRYHSKNSFNVQHNQFSRLTLGVQLIILIFLCFLLFRQNQVIQFQFNFNQNDSHSAQNRQPHSTHFQSRKRPNRHNSLFLRIRSQNRNPPNQEIYFLMNYNNFDQIFEMHL